MSNHAGDRYGSEESERFLDELAERPDTVDLTNPVEMFSQTSQALLVDIMALNS